MRLEVDGRHGNVPIPCQRESEIVKYVNGHVSYSIPPTAEVHGAVGTASEHVGPPEMSKPRNLGLVRRVRVRQSLIFCWRAPCSLLSPCWLLWQQVWPAQLLQEEGRTWMHGLSAAFKRIWGLQLLIAGP